MLPYRQKPLPSLACNISPARLLRCFAATMALFLLGILTAASGWALVAQTSMATPQQLVAALIDAVQADDDAALLNLLGPDSADLISSGDPVADRNDRSRFLQAYTEKNSLEQNDQGQVVFLVGSEDYPFPIPIIRQADGWLFDTQAGLEEILNRRIGRNELHTIEVIQAYTAAQREYAVRQRNQGVATFAQRLASTDGNRDGLYWDAGEGELESPLGPLLARASEEGYAAGLNEDSPDPFYGYYFKNLKSQGGHANGGAFDYVSDGKMVLGFALVAYPANYGASGIMTFIVNQEGVIYEKDLGETTGLLAAAMTSFDPDDSWSLSLESAGQ